MIRERKTLGLGKDKVWRTGKEKFGKGIEIWGRCEGCLPVTELFPSPEVLLGIKGEIKPVGFL